MKVPSPTQGRTRNVTLAQSYAQGASNPGAGLALASKGLGSLADARLKLEATFKTRDEQTDKFNTLKGFSEFQTTTAQQLTELKRGYSADGKGFADAANNKYTELENQWITNVPEDLQDEFRYRSQEARRGVLGDALSFQYKAGDAWFNQGVSDEISKSKTILDQNPKALAAEQKRLAEFIQATDLPQIDKEKLAREAVIGLASVTYKAEIRSDPSKAGEIGVGQADAKSILRSAEGFRPEPYWDVNAWRIGYGSDTITLPDGSHKKVEPGMRISQADAERDLDYRLSEREGAQARNQIGPTWNNLPKNVQGALTSVAYNYGSLPDTVVEAVKSGSTEDIATAVAGLSANKSRRLKEAAIIRGEAGLDTDPRFAVIPFEDRVALRDDANREYNAEQTQQAALAKATRDKQQNDLYLGLLDGTKGQVDIDNERSKGVLDDYNSVNKALGILKDRDANQNMAMSGYEKLASGSPFDPTDADDKKRLNAIVKQGGGLQRLAAGDKDYVSDGLVPMVNQTGDIPTDVAGTLLGMVRGADNNRAMYALDALAQLRDASGTAFNQRVSDDVAKQVDLWDSIKDTAPQEEALAAVRGGTTQSERQQRAVLRKEGEDLLTRSEGGVPKGEALLDSAIGEFGGTTWSANVAAPLARQALSKEFNALFIDAYAKTGDETKAGELAAKALQRNWGVTAVGGGKDLMKYPPEKVGYRPIGGSYDWINESVRKELALGPKEDFDLFSDEQTRQEFQAFQRDPSASPPSYRTFLKDENGVYRERTDPQGLPLRMNFKPDPVVVQKEAEIFDKRDRVFELQEKVKHYRDMRAYTTRTLQTIPQENTDEYNSAVEELKTLEPELKQLQKPADPFGDQIRENMNSGGMF